MSSRSAYSFPGLTPGGDSLCSSSGSPMLRPTVPARIEAHLPDPGTRTGCPAGSFAGSRSLSCDTSAPSRCMVPRVGRWRRAHGSGEGGFPASRFTDHGNCFRRPVATGLPLPRPRRLAPGCPVVAVQVFRFPASGARRGGRVRVRGGSGSAMIMTARFRFPSGKWQACLMSGGDRPQLRLPGQCMRRVLRRWRSAAGTRSR